MKFEAVDPKDYKLARGSATNWAPVAAALRSGQSVLITDVNPNTMRAALRQHGIKPLHVNKVDGGFLVSTDV